MTLIIPTYQRREPLIRLLVALSQELTASEVYRSEFDIVVVIDGSTDGSYEALQDLEIRVPLTVRAESHRGRPAARNIGLESANGELVWFLDDDLVPSANLIARHRCRHGTAYGDLLVGAVPAAPGVAIPAELQGIWNGYPHLGCDGLIRDVREVGFANTSGPTSLLREIGGFDEAFTEYGLEDTELGARLLERGVVIRFDAEAIAWSNASDLTFDILRRRSRETGRNAVRVALAHPWTSKHLFDVRAGWRGMRLLSALHVRSAEMLALVSQLAAVGASIGSGILGRHRVTRLKEFALATSFAAGVADRDSRSEFLCRIFGQCGA